MDRSVIISSMSALKNDYIAAELEKIYSEIFSKVSAAPAEKFANLFTSLESKAVSDFYLNLEKELRQTAYSAMKAAGVSETAIPAAWVRVRNAVPAPKPLLCNEGNYAPPQTTVSSGAVKSASQKETSQLPELGKWILISGVIIEVLSWIFIPSYKVWAPIVRGIGLVIIAAGGYKIYQETKAPSRIPLTEEAMRSEQQKATENVKKICAKQYELNCRIYYKWLDEVISAIVKECADC